MAGRGEYYKNADGKWNFRVWAGSDIIADSNQGYENKSECVERLTKLMAGDYDGPIEQSGS